MKIAVIASQNGEKAQYLYDFFKEGNRITVDCLLTDDAASPVAQSFGNEGIEIITITPATDFEPIVERMKDHDVKVLVVDGEGITIPPSLTDYFGEGIVYPSTAAAAPLEVIKTADKIINPEPEPATARFEPAKNPEPATGETNPTHKEWAEALNIDTKQTEQQPPQQPQQPQQQQPAQQQPPQPTWNPQQWVHPQWGQQQPQQAPYPQQPYNQHPYGPMPNTYLVWSVIITILFSTIPGVIAIIYSSKVSSRYYRGDVAGARKASRIAQLWCIVSILLGVLWLTFYLPLILLTAS